MRRRSFLVLSASAAILPALPLAAGPAEIVVTKDAYCGCCGAWVEHLRAAGFSVDVREVEGAALNALKARLGIGPDLASCHTAQAAGYWIEGHVPAEDIARLLSERPQAAGLAVPGMPAGSPGMETGGEPEPFDTLLVGPAGAVSVYASHG